MKYSIMRVTFNKALSLMKKYIYARTRAFNTYPRKTLPKLF